MKRKNLKKDLSKALKILFLFVLSSCSSIEQLDKPFCVEVNITKGFCTTPMTGKDQIVDEEKKLEGKTWFEIRPTMILIPPSTYAAIKKFILTQCKRNERLCDEQIPSWDRATTVIDSQLNTKSE